MKNHRPCEYMQHTARSKIKVPTKLSDVYKKRLCTITSGTTVTDAATSNDVKTMKNRNDYKQILD